MTKRLALILACALGPAACGTSAGNQTRDLAKGYSQAVAFSQCMRAHGVPGFPDPVARGGTVSLSIGPKSGVDPRSPAFHSAQTACRHLMPGGGPTSGAPSAQARAQMLRISECMRAHGISGFPDPTTIQPTTGDEGLVMGHDGVFLAIPSSIDTRSPAFQHAAAVCGFGPPGGRPPGA